MSYVVLVEYDDCVATQGTFRALVQSISWQPLFVSAYFLWHIASPIEVRGSDCIPLPTIQFQLPSLGKPQIATTPLGLPADLACISPVLLLHACHVSLSLLHSQPTC